MAAETTTTLDGYFKEVYLDGPEHTVPQHAQLSLDIPFNSAQRQGDSFHVPIRLRRCHGITYNNDGTAFTILAALPGAMKDANVSASQMLLTEQVSYTAASRARTSKEAFGDVMDEVVFDVEDTSAFYLEMAMLYGGGAGNNNIGVISADPGTGPGARGVVITVDSWAAGLWAQMEGARVDVYDSTYATQRSNSATGGLIVDTVDDATRTVTLSGDEGDLDDIAINDVIIPFGAHTKWFAGIDTILKNTGSLFGIDAATYGLWEANVVSASSGPLTMAKLCNASARPGYRSGKFALRWYVSTFAWTDLNNDHAALRRFTESTKSGLDLGTEKITYYGPNGMLEIVQHPMVKASEAFGLNMRSWKRLGSTDWTWRLQGLEGQENRFFMEIPSIAGYEIRRFTDQCMLCKRPAGSVKINNIVNNSGPS